MENGSCWDVACVVSRSWGISGAVVLLVEANKAKDPIALREKLPAIFVLFFALELRGDAAQCKNVLKTVRASCRFLLSVSASSLSSSGPVFVPLCGQASSQRCVFRLPVSFFLLPGFAA